MLIFTQNVDMKIGIIGCGTMGTGIAQVAATAGESVAIYDVNSEALTKSKAGLNKMLNRLVEKGKWTKEKAEKVLGNISFTDQLSDLYSADLIIEAIVENIDIKLSVFQKLEANLSEKAIIASNTSSLSITSLAAGLENPNRFVGIHFFNPAPLMRLVEIIPAVQTDEGTLNAALVTISSWGKTTVKVKDTPGFIVNKVARPFYGEALRILEEGMADVATIDWAMKSIGGFRMGPFELMDFIGNDVNYTVTETVYNAFYQDGRYKPAFTQKRLSEAGYLGRKSGRGYYDYQEGAKNQEANQDPSLGEYIVNRILVMLINEAADTAYLNIASAEDIDLAMCNGVNYPKGLLAWANELGIQYCKESMDELFERYHEERYRCSPLLRDMAKNGQNFFA